MSILQQLALTHGYEKSAPLPYPAQAHHKPQNVMEKTHSWCVLQIRFGFFARYSLSEVVIRAGI